MARTRVRHAERKRQKALDAQYRKIDACKHASRRDETIGAVRTLVCLDCEAVFEPDAEAAGGGYWVPR